MIDNNVIIRELRRDDMSALRSIIDGTGLFPSEMLVAMAEPFLAGGSNHHWWVAVTREKVVGFAYIEPERMTEGTYNLLLIAVDPTLQGAGIGRAIVDGLSERLRRLGGRILLVETSSLDEFAGTRAFYDVQGFTKEARIRDFYNAGEDKIVFWKQL